MHFLHKNTLKVYGLPEQLARFDSDFVGLPRNPATTERRRCFNAIVPMPNDVAESGEWLPWSMANWGAKWDIYADAMGAEPIDGGLAYEFETADGVPYAWVRRVCSLYPQLCFVLLIGV